MSFKCYAYADDTHEYICPVEGYEDPIDSSKVVYPRNTTTIAPPQYDGGTVPVFDQKIGGWAIVVDYRGQYGFDPNGVLVLITRAGDPSTFNPPLTTTLPTPTPKQVDNDFQVDPNWALRTSKVAFFRRTIETEAAQFMADLTEASPRLKAIFDSVSYLVPGAEEYPALRAAVEARVGSARADELLAPSND